MKPYDLIIKTPFPGYPQTIVEKETKIVHFSDLPLEEYLKANPEMRVVTVEEYEQLHHDHHVRAFSEITEEIWDSALNCLPPLKWHTIQEKGQQLNVFFCSEPYSGTIHGFYLFDRRTRKYYCCKIDVRTKDSDIVKKYLDHIKPA
jgi:hypothetical protein